MISIITCSRTPKISDSLKTNIATTIGTDYEIVTVDNSANKYSIFEAYNIGAERSKYPFLCFMHDDIEYHTANWGQSVLAHFEDSQTGAIGIAGTPYAAWMPGSWWGSGLVNQYILPVGNKRPDITKVAEPANSRNEVLLLDGVWMCIRRSLFEQVSFDTANYTGFHFYDVDIALQINRLKYKLYSVFDVLITHYSKGDMNQNWIDNALAYHYKWRGQLPSSVIALSYSQASEAELKTINEFVSTMLFNGYPSRDVYKLAVSKLLGFGRGLFYYKTPLYIIKYLGMAVTKQGSK